MDISGKSYFNTLTTYYLSGPVLGTEDRVRAWIAELMTVTGRRGRIDGSHRMIAMATGA